MYMMFFKVLFFPPTFQTLILRLKSYKHRLSPEAVLLIDIAVTLDKQKTGCHTISGGRVAVYY